MSNPTPLEAPEAACLRTLRSTTGRKSVIALHAGLNLRQTDCALRTLASLSLAQVDPARVWSATEEGRQATIEQAAPPKRRGRRRQERPTVGSAAERMLALLDRPRYGRDLITLLGVTKQRVHQLAVVLSVAGKLRSLPGASLTFAVARADDPTPLLTAHQARVLSAFPDGEATTLPQLKRASRLGGAAFTPLLEALEAAGLIKRAGGSAKAALYRLTQPGAQHWQRETTESVAEPPALPYRSNRIMAALGYIDRHGPVSIRDLAVALDVEGQSMNALVQRLKGQGMVRPASNTFHAPYVLTDAGREVLSVIRRRTRAQDPSDAWETETEQHCAAA